MKTVAYWIKALALAPHPEGGFFRRTYTCERRLRERGRGAGGKARQHLASAIYYLLRAGEYSALHRLGSDELWHFYCGSSLTLHLIGAQGDYTPVRLGPAPEDGHRFQALAPAGVWFGATVDAQAPDAYALVGCTLAPEFVPEAFELGRRSALLARYPQHRSLIERLTRADKLPVRSA